MSEKEDTYHDTILDLEAKLKKNVDLILKLDSEDTLEEAFKTQQKMNEKMIDPIAVANKQSCWTINYKKLNALYEDFVPQKELSVEQKYFSSSSIPSVKIPVSKNMPSESPLIKELDKIKVGFEKLSLLIQQNCKRASIFYTSPAEIEINDFCQDQVKPILNELKVYLECFRNLFQRDIKEMKDVFESTESELDELEKQNELLKDQLLEASLKHDVELCVLINHECVDKILNAELEKVKKKSFEIQEDLQARIKILEKDVQRCEKQSVDFQLKLQHEKEKQKWDSTSKNKITIPLDYSWISKMEKLEDENVSLDFTVQSLIKERDNAKMEYKKLFDSIKKTRSQTQKEMDELIVHVSEKTYAYGAIRAENQNLLTTISELKKRLEKAEKGKSVNTKFDKTNGFQSLLCVTPLNKQAFIKKSNVHKTEETNVVSKPVTLQTSPTKQKRVNQNTNVIRPGMYRVVITQESQTSKTKSALSSTGMNPTSRVRRPMSRYSHVAHSILHNPKKEKKNVAVYVWKNKQEDVIPNKNASKVKTLLFKKWVVKLPSFHVASLSMVAGLGHNLFRALDIIEMEDIRSGFVVPNTLLLYEIRKEMICSQEDAILICILSPFLTMALIFSRCSCPKQLQQSPMVTPYRRLAPPVVITSDEQTSPISLTEAWYRIFTKGRKMKPNPTKPSMERKEKQIKADEFNQEDTADFDGNAQFVPYNPPSHEEIESSTTALEPSNVQNFH
ncbi:hypothetical protein Tco_0665473 [Tanacetum coccineum]